MTVYLLFVDFSISYSLLLSPSLATLYWAWSHIYTWECTLQKTCLLVRVCLYWCAIVVSCSLSTHCDTYRSAILYSKQTVHHFNLWLHISTQVLLCVVYGGEYQQLVWAGFQWIWWEGTTKVGPCYHRCNEGSGASPKPQECFHQLEHHFRKVA